METKSLKAKLLMLSDQEMKSTMGGNAKTVTLPTAHCTATKPVKKLL